MGDEGEAGREEIEKEQKEKRGRKRKRKREEGVRRGGREGEREGATYRVKIVIIKGFHIQMLFSYFLTV